MNFSTPKSITIPMKFPPFFFRSNLEELRFWQNEGHFSSILKQFTGEFVPPPMRKCGTINKYFGNHCLLCEYFTIKCLMPTLVKTNKSIYSN